MNHNFCIILAGGIGQRLWPTSRREMPKQFLDFFGTGRTLLQQTFDRFARIIPLEHILISTFVDYVNTVKEQLPDLPEENILAEPVQLSTAPAAAWAACHIAGLDADANVVATPVDHLIMGEDRFIEQIRLGLEFVATHSQFLAIGVKPTAPNTAYGYIQMGKPVNGGDHFMVKSFSEKPAPDYARLFVESGEFLWNTGLFLWHNETMLNLVGAHSELKLSKDDGGVRDRLLAQELEIVKKHYPSSLHRSLDMVVLDRCENVVVKEGGFGWADLGCWPDIYQTAHKDADGNAVLHGSQALLQGCHNTTVSLPDNTAAFIQGLDGYIVSLRGNMLLVCPNNDPALARRIAGEVLVKLGEDYT